MRMRVRLRQERGFSLVEMLIALTVLNIALFALLAAFTSGALSLRRAAQTTTAAVVAENRAEMYRALSYDEIVLQTVALVNADATYWNDPVVDEIVKGKDDDDGKKIGFFATDPGTGPSAKCPGDPPPDRCDPTVQVKGPDGKSYRVDTYVLWYDKKGAEQAKRVTIVVRDPDGGEHSVARLSTVYHRSTG